MQKIRDNSLQNLYTSIPRTGLEPVSVEGVKKDCSKLAFEAGEDLQIVACIYLLGENQVS